VESVFALKYSLAGAGNDEWTIVIDANANRSLGSPETGRLQDGSPAVSHDI